LPYLPVAEAIDKVIVYHSNRLHVGINRRRTDEAESPPLEVLAESLGFARYRWNLPRSFPAVKPWPSVNETPAVGVERSELFPDFEKCACVAYADSIFIRFRMISGSDVSFRIFVLE
jgi:hypothetical protein